MHPTLEVAPALLGKKLVTWAWDRRRARRREVSGMIVEVEAYHQYGDFASHSWRGLTKRNQPMFMQGGHCYVYFIYGMHYCVNVVTEMAGIGAAVLIRAMQPLKGVDVMQRRRKTEDLKALLSGPGKICQAFGIRPAFSGDDFLSSGRIRLRNFRHIPFSQIAQSKRVGISRSRHLPWRFTIKDNPWVSTRV